MTVEYTVPLQQAVRASGNFGASHSIQPLKVLVLLTAPDPWKDALRHLNAVARHVAGFTAQQQEADPAQAVFKLFRILCGRSSNSFNPHAWS